MAQPEKDLPVSQQEKQLKSEIQNKEMELVDEIKQLTETGNSKDNLQESFEESSSDNETTISTESKTKTKKKRSTFHLKVQLNADKIRRQTCYKCGKNYKSKMYLQRHIKEVHILHGYVPET